MKDCKDNFRDNRSYKEVVSRGTNTEKPKSKVGFCERSVTGEVSSPMSRNEVQKTIDRIGVEVENMLSMGMYKFLITFNSKKEAEEAANHK